MKKIKIAIACELAPAKTIIPVIKRIKKLEKEGKLNWQSSEIIALTHGSGVRELIEPYSDEIYSIGQGRGAGKVKRNAIELAYLIAKDTFKAFLALRGKGIDLLITCGNAGDVRKSIVAAKILRIPVIHIEQDIYNPIETIAFSNLITVPEEKYRDFFTEVYDMNKETIQNIQGYPMASYFNDFVASENSVHCEDDIENEDDFKKNIGILEHDFSEFILVFLGGDLKSSDLKDLIIAIENCDYPTLIVPYRFEKESIEHLVNSSKIKVLGGYVNLLSLMKSAKLLIYGAGMGITIEAGVLEIPSIKIAGFHKKHGSVDLAKRLNIPILEIDKLADILSDFNKSDMKINIDKPNGEELLKNSQIATEKLVEIINNFDLKNPPKSNGFKSMKAIWKERSKYR